MKFKENNTTTVMNSYLKKKLSKEESCYQLSVSSLIYISSFRNKFTKEWRDEFDEITGLNKDVSDLDENILTEIVEKYNEKYDNKQMFCGFLEYVCTLHNCLMPEKYKNEIEYIKNLGIFNN